MKITSDAWNLIMLKTITKIFVVKHRPRAVLSSVLLILDRVSLVNNDREITTLTRLTGKSLANF